MATTPYPMVSSDGHLEVLPERWSGRMPAKYRKLAPHTTTLPDGSDAIAMEGAAPSADKREGMQWNRWQQVELDDLLEDMTSMAFILHFTFSHPDMHTNIVGTINPAHLQDNVNALLKGPLPPDVYAEVKRRLTAVGLRPEP